MEGNNKIRRCFLSDKKLNAIERNFSDKYDNYNPYEDEYSRSYPVEYCGLQDDKREMDYLYELDWINNQKKFKKRNLDKCNKKTIRRNLRKLNKELSYLKMEKLINEVNFLEEHYGEFLGDPDFCPYEFIHNSYRH